MGKVIFPPWADMMRQIFRAETISQFIIHGNVNDLVVHCEDEVSKVIPLKPYLCEVMFAPFDCILSYDRGQGIVVHKGEDYFYGFCQAVDKYLGTRYSSYPAAASSDTALSSSSLWPRAPLQALELIDRFLHSTAIRSQKGNTSSPLAVAILIDYAQFILPRGESIHIANDIGSVLIKILRWAEDPSISGKNIITCLITENLLDLHETICSSSYNAKIKIELPTQTEILQYLKIIVREENSFTAFCILPVDMLALKLAGLSRINIQNTILRALRNSTEITLKYLAKLRKETIEKEAIGKLEFIDSPHSLDDVAGHREAKQWLRDDALLMKKGAVHALPMGYLVTGRIGTGKTWLIQCFAGECDIPFVELKNFRDKWVGTTEGNLEKIFSILHAFGQVIVFIDEADQVTGKRDSGDGDSGLSGRIYAMLAKEMSDTRNRGKILWIFATSRPDLLEVDLKRQGRLDVHIPLFPPEDEAEKQELFTAMARKIGIDLKPQDLPPLPFAEPISGNEMEGLLVRAARRYELQVEQNRQSFADILKQEVAGFIPSMHTTRIALMDLLAVKECTDKRFLPKRFALLDPVEIDKRIAEMY